VSIRPAVASAATIVSVVSLFLLSPLWGGAVYTALLILLLLLAQRGTGARLGRRLISWTGPFLVPLLLFHGVLNGQFPVTSWWLDTIPIRSIGLAFGYGLAVRILLFSVVAAYWLSVDPDDMVEALLRLRLPTPLIMLAMQGFVMGRLVQNRIQSIHLAQRARGIPVSASLAQRIASMPALLIPVVVGTFVEAEARVPVLLAHGYGRLEPSTQPAQLELRTAILALAMLAFLAAALTVDRLW
jgi:energy-coupling factor transporter transmembrane protein EcfT